MPWSRTWVVSHWVWSPCSHMKQCPQEIWNGTTTRSPGAISVTSLPTSSTVPIGSCPSTSPSPMNGPITSYRWRSEPQIAVVVIRTTASVGFSMAGSGTVSTRTSRLPCQVTAFMGSFSSGLGGHVGLPAPPEGKRSACARLRAHPEGHAGKGHAEHQIPRVEGVEQGAVRLHSRDVVAAEQNGERPERESHPEGGGAVAALLQPHIRSVREVACGEADVVLGHELPVDLASLRAPLAEARLVVEAEDGVGEPGRPAGGAEALSEEPA